MSSAKTTAKVIVATLFLFVLTACNTSPKPENVYQKVSDATLKAGAAIPAPKDSAILTVTGKIGAKNSGDNIEMDLPTLESVGLVDYKVADPFEKRPTVFRGVLMSSLLDLWKVDKDATTLEMVALNDYKVDVPIAELRQYPIIFALQQDGKYMPVSTRGPAMLVYPYDHFQFDRQKYDDRWIWQIKSIKVK
jgi:hypothetical protein